MRPATPVQTRLSRVSGGDNSAYIDLPPGTYQIISKLTPSGQAVQVIFTVDMNDGVGSRKGSVRVDYLGPGAILVNTSNIPVHLDRRHYASYKLSTSVFRDQPRAAVRLFI